MRSVVSLLALALCLVALPVFAAEEAPAQPACVNMTPVDSYTQDTLPVENGNELLTPDPSQQAGCTGWARCADGRIVSCSGTYGCGGIDDCYAYCNNSTFVWCSYRPHPCPI